jgi:hypothetical protein
VESGVLEQKAEGFSVWQQPMVELRLPMLFNLRSDPFERAQHESGDYVRWFIEHAFVVVPAQTIVGQHQVTVYAARVAHNIAGERKNCANFSCLGPEMSYDSIGIPT